MPALRRAPGARSLSAVFDGPLAEVSCGLNETGTANVDADAVPSGARPGGLALVWDSVSALLVPPLVLVSMISLGWVAYVWWQLQWAGVLYLVGVVWGLSIAFRVVRRRARTITALLYCTLLLAAFFWGGLAYSCVLWSISDGSCF